ncbi:hypothetical protein IX83_02310 [Basilea psittacipulmonis DSM 24701]|uniref:Uncharacterized protein n=1 Tax=Basilea psittacipulmonis DSM 24701 TaxID=1072685 RepID=A0A077DGN0_9BURK|nr:hypothetical protein IX83_02310 [Basilea psittacipulmonis DSM 24701]
MHLRFKWGAFFMRLVIRLVWDTPREIPLEACVPEVFYACSISYNYFRFNDEGQRSYLMWKR